MYIICIRNYLICCRSFRVGTSIELYTKRELTRTVLTNIFVTMGFEPLSPTIPIPSVSSSSNTNSSHSRATVDSQIPRVHASIEWPTLNEPGLLTIREMKYDLPVRAGPHTASTATGLRMAFSKANASSFILRWMGLSWHSSLVTLFSTGFH